MTSLMTGCADSTGRYAPSRRGRTSWTGWVGRASGTTSAGSSADGASVGTRTAAAASRPAATEPRPDAHEVPYRAACDNRPMTPQEPPPDDAAPEGEAPARSPAEQLHLPLIEGDWEATVALAARLHPAELADALERLDDHDREMLFQTVPNEVLGEALYYVEPHFRGQLVQGLPAPQLGEMLEGVADDVATDFVQDMEPDTAGAVLDSLDEDRRHAIERLLTHPEDTAGGRMTGQLVTVRPEFTVARTLELLRQLQPDASQPFYLYVIDDRRRLCGVVNLRNLITSPGETLVSSVMGTELISVRADADQEEAARLLRQYRLLALPVVDSHDRLLGTVTSDDVLDVIEEEATEDMFRMVGVSEEEDLRDVWRSVRYRLPWLSVNLLTALAAGYVVSLFQDTLATVVVLTAFLPVIAGHGGNAGIQTLTVVVRSLALGRVSIRDASLLIKHEVVTGTIMGLVSGSLVALVALMWQGDAWLGLVVGVALLANVVIGAVFGTLIPLALDRLGQDPALSGGIWLTTTTDVLGFLFYLGTATLMIGYLD
ncbi:MAG: magnesium transporter [Dehalococcoidia bacterium]|nr:magnesium transporter [Dehalococcoidia bacterium]